MDIGEKVFLQMSALFEGRLLVLANFTWPSAKIWNVEKSTPSLCISSSSYSFRQDPEGESAVGFSAAHGERRNTKHAMESWWRKNFFLQPEERRYKKDDEIFDVFY